MPPIVDVFVVLVYTTPKIDSILDSKLFIKPNKIFMLSGVALFGFTKSNKPFLIFSSLNAPDFLFEKNLKV